VFFEILIWLIEMNVQNIYSLSLVLVLMFDEECLHDKAQYRTVLTWTILYFLDNFIWDVLFHFHFHYTEIEVVGAATRPGCAKACH